MATKLFNRIDSASTEFLSFIIGGIIPFYGYYPIPDVVSLNKELENITNQKQGDLKEDEKPNTTNGES